MYNHKDLLGLKGLDKEEINHILLRADEFYAVAAGNNKKLPTLSGKSVFLTFYENSTRTSCSFDHAVKILSGNSLSLSVRSSSVNKGEDLIDTVQNLQAVGADAIVIRHKNAGAPHTIAKHLSCAVVNAGDGQNEHPTQALLDILTMQREFGKNLKGLNVFICGDIKHSRVARSNIWGLNALGASVKLFAPPTLMPIGICEAGCSIAQSVEDGIKDADVIMALRLQLERQTSGIIPSIKEYSEFYGLVDERLRNAKKSAIIMHPGPMNRGAEITSSLANSKMSRILNQVTAGVAVRMAVLDILINRN